MAATQIVPGLYAIPVGPVNTFLLDSPDRCTLIDTGLPGSEDKILKTLIALGRNPKEIRRILLTHAHPDHIGGFAAMKKATGAESYMHPLDAQIANLRQRLSPDETRTGLTHRHYVPSVRPVLSIG